MILCSADVASALTMAGVLDYTPALNANLNVDDTGNTFAGVLAGKYRVYIDPYAANSAPIPSTTLLVIRVLLLMTLVCSTAHTFLFRWFVPLVRTPSNLRLDSRLATESLLTHSRKAPLLAQAHSPVTPTVTTDVLRFPTSCDSSSHISQRVFGPSFFCLNI